MRNMYGVSQENMGYIAEYIKNRSKNITEDIKNT